MVRETRHLWVGNLPHTIREERILDHFKRYGKVQSVKILPKKEEEAGGGGGGGGACATVAFIDIKSAAKAHNAENKIDERTLKTDYYEPPASSTASSAIFIHERDDTLVGRNAVPPPPPPPAPYAAGRNARYGLPEDRNYERPGHYYERVSDREPYMRRPIGMGYHDEDNYQGRAKSRDRYVRSATGSTYAEGTERSQNHFRTHNTRQHFEQTRFSEQYNDERDVASAAPRLNRRTNNGSAASVVSSVASPTAPAPPSSRSESRSRRMKRRSPSRTPSGSRSRSNSMSRSRSRSSSGSRSSSSSSKLRSSSSDSSGRSRSPSKSRSPVTSYGSQSSLKGSRLERPASAITNPSSNSSYLSSSVSSASTVNCTSTNSQASTSVQSATPTANENSCDKEEKKPLGICVRNLPVRSTDTSLKDGLFHEYKKHGKVTMVKVIGQGTERYAVVCFKKPEDVDKALEVSKDKLFFGCKIEVTAHEGLDADDNEFRPLEAELDEFHPKATRTLFIGNLEKDITTAELRKHFDQFGEIIEIDIKKQGSATSYAFIQYSDIASVVKAMRKLDGENLGANRIKLGFGKSMPTNCVWLDGVVDTISEKFLARHFSRFGLVAYCAIDREKGHALVFYDSVEFAQIAVSEMRGRILGGKKLQVDFASRECQTTFFDKLEMTGQIVLGDRPWERRDRRTAEFDILRGDDRYGRDSRVGFENRVYARYEGQPRTNRGNFRGIQRTAFSGRGRGQTFPARYEMYYDEFGERRHRYSSRDESGSDGLPFDGKTERLKYAETAECSNRKRNKLRNSISDQESHHSQSPPRSRHESRSTSPVPKDRKSLKDRMHHRIKSPGSNNSSLVSSPCRESANEEPMELANDFKDYRLKNSSEEKNELGDSDASFPLSSPKSSSLHDVQEKGHLKGDSDLCRRRSIDSDIADENSSASEQLSQLERKRRLLASTVSSSLGKDAGLTLSKSASDRLKLKSSLCHTPVNKVGQENCVSHSLCDDKSDLGSAELHDESLKEKLRPGESANTDLKYLQKKQVHILHLLEQLHEGVNSSDTDGSVDGDRYSRKKHRSLSSCVESLYSEKDLSKAITKDECNAKSIKSGLKDQISLARGINKTDHIDSNNCFSLSLDSFVFRKHLDPRKVDHQTLGAVNSLQNCRRVSVEKDDLLPSNSQQSSDSLCASSTELTWKKQCGDSVQPSHGSKDLSSAVHSKVKDEPADGDVCSGGKTLFQVSDVSKTTARTFPDSLPHEVKRERDVSPLSLPLPKFAATLKSPKSSASMVTSPRSVAQSPRRVHSPNSFSCTKSVKLAETLHEFHGDKKKENCFDEKLNGTSFLSSAASSPSESNLHSEASDITCLEPIQSPKSSSEKNRDSVIASSDSDLSPISSPNRPSIEDRIKALDEKFNAWSGSTQTANSNSIPETPPPTVIDLPKGNVKKRSRFNFLVPEIRTEPSDIVKSLLAKSTIFDQDSMRLQHINEKYEPLNVKMDLSPKVKPTFRTKAAAKEFSSPITPTLPTFNSSALPKLGSVLSGSGVTSPPDTPHSAIGNSVLSPVTPPTPFTQVSTQLFTPCSPRVSSFPSLSSSKDLDDIPFPTGKEVPGDQAGLTPKVVNTAKVKTEPVVGVVSPIEVMSHGLLTNSLPIGVKNEPMSLKENIQPLSNLTENAFNTNNKKELSVLKANIPAEKDYTASVLKDQILFKSVNSVDLNRRELGDKQHTSLQGTCTKWKDLGRVDDVIDVVTKSLPNLDSSELRLVTPAAKKRLSSIDSSESESSKSCKSVESGCEGQDFSWQKQEKVDTKSMEPECKKAKLSVTKTSERERSPTPVPTTGLSRKIERKEKPVKSDKVKSDNPKPNSQASFDKDEPENKNMSKSETKEKSKSDSHKSRDEKKNKTREQKDISVKNDQHKSSERKSSEKDSKCSSNSSSGSTKTKKEHSSSKTEKVKTEKKNEKKANPSKSKQKLEFDLPIDEEPVYFSMYDKVKARSSKTQTLKHQAKDLETMRQKFSKLKQTRAKKEEKSSKSVDHDTDKDSDYMSDHSSDSDAQTKASKSKQQRKRKLVIESSSDDEMPQSSQNRTTKNKESADSESDSESEQKSPQKQLSSRGRKKKLDVIESDSSDSLSQPPSRPQAGGKKKSKSRPVQNKKVIKSDGEDSEAEASGRAQSKEKEHKRKKAKKSKTHEPKQDKEATEQILSKKPVDDAKGIRKKLHKEEKQQSDTPSQPPKYDESSRDKGVKERSSNDSEMMDVDATDKFRSGSKKKKKSKKTSRSKEKRTSSDRRRSSEFTSKKDDESESKSSLPVLSSPRPTSPVSDKPLSPPCLQATDMAEEPSSDHPSVDFGSHSIQDTQFPSNEWKQKSLKNNTVPPEKSQKSSKKKDFSPSKQQQHPDLSSDVEQDLSSPDKIRKIPTPKDQTCHSTNLESGRKRAPSSSSSSKKNREPSLDICQQKVKHEKTTESVSKYEEEKPRSDSGSHQREEKRKKKLKKQSKEKKVKVKDEPPKENIVAAPTPTHRPSSPMLFESVSLDSRLSDIRLDEEIAEEARRLEQELMGASEETSTFEDESGACIKKEEKPAERKFEEEAAKETKRLEAELFSTSHESWHMKDKSFGPEMHSDSLDAKEGGESSSLSGKEESLFASLNLHTTPVGGTPQHESDIFLPGHDAAQYKLEDKDAASEIDDDQRKIEDDLAVSALLQEMNSEIPAPELTKEADFLEPLMAGQPEDTMNYLIPGDGSLNTVDDTPDLLMNENNEPRLDSENMILSPLSNSEPPALEISTFEDSLSLKDLPNSRNAHEVLPTTSSDSVCETYSDKSTAQKPVGESSVQLPIEEPQNRPPVIDTPRESDTLESVVDNSSISPQSGRMPDKKWTERSPKPLKDVAQLSGENDGETNMAHSESSPGEFEDITMDIADGKDDDTPPVLLPVDLPPRLSSAEGNDTKEASEVHISQASETSSSIALSVISENLSVQAAGNEKQSTVTSDSEHVLKESESDLTLSLADFDDSCSGLAPLTISEFCEPSKESPENEQSDAEESCSKTENRTDLSGELNLCASLTDSLLTKNKSYSDEKKITSDSLDADNTNSTEEAAVDNNDTEFRSLDYPDYLEQKQSPPSEQLTESKPEVTKHDTSVIKSTSSISSVCSSFTEHSSKYMTEAEDCDPHVITTDSFLYNVFGTNKENRGMVIFSTSQLAKQAESSEPCADVEKSSEEKMASDKQETPKQPEEDKSSFIDAPTTVREVKEPLIEPQPLHFPPLFTIPTEPLLSPEVPEKASEGDTHNEDREVDDDVCNNPDRIEVEEEVKVEEAAKEPAEEKHSVEIQSIAVHPDAPEIPEQAVPDSNTADSTIDSSVQEPQAVSLKETLLKIDEKSGEEKKPDSADVESVSSDTTDIAFPDIKAEFEMSQLTSGGEEQAPEDTVPEEVEEKPAKVERPRRGRRNRARRSSESASKASESRSEAQATTNPLPARSGKRGRAAPVERTRRFLRSDATEHLDSGDKDQGTENKKDTNSQPETEVKHSVLENNKTTEHAGESVDVMSDVPNSYEDTEPKQTERVYNTRSEESRRRRGRRKKSSGEHHPLGSHEKSETKLEDAEHPKDYHRPKESRFWLSLSSEKEQRSHSKESSSAYDVYDFPGSEDDEPNFNRGFQSSVKERLHDNVRSISTASVHESKNESKHSDKHLETPSSEKKSEEPKYKPNVTDERDSGNKEYVTELNQHGNLVIRLLHQKDGHDGTSAGTSEGIKTSESSGSEENKTDAAKSTRSSASKESTSEPSHSGPSKSTRKSTRLMNQAARSSVDDVIEDVVKGNFKSGKSLPPEPAPQRVTRRTRSSRKIEEATSNPAPTATSSLPASSAVPEDSAEDKNKHEPMFVILDNAVKDIPETKKNALLQSADLVPPVSESTNHSEPEKTHSLTAALRSFRITHSASSRVDSQKENPSSSESSHETEQHHKETALPEETKELPSKDHKKDILTNIAETLPCHPPVPVLKVEIPRISHSSTKDFSFQKVHLDSGTKELKVEEPEENSDSRSSPTALIDPKTGVLTPVRKKGETSEKHESFKCSAQADEKVATNKMFSGFSDVTAPDVGQKTSVVEKHGRPGTWDSLSTSRSVLSTNSFAGQSVSNASSVPAAVISKKEPPAVSSEVTPAVDSTVQKGQDLSTPACAHVGVLTSVMPNAVVLPIASGASAASGKIVSHESSAVRESTQSPVMPLTQQSYGRGSVASGLTVSKSLPESSAVVTSNPVATSVVSSQQQLLRTVVTAVVTVASTDLATSLPPKVHTKSVSSHSPDLSNAVTVKSETTLAPCSASSSAASLDTLSSVPKAAAGEQAATSQHWNAAAEKDGLPSQVPASAVASSNWPGSAKLNPSSDLPRLMNTIQSIPALQAASCKSDSRISHSGSTSASKTAVYHQQPSYPSAMYESSVHSSLHNLAAVGSGGVIAELLQNPQLLQQHKEYLAATAASGSQFQDRGQGQVVRPSTPVASGIPPDVAARLGNPTPPHTPTPPVSTSAHSLPPSDMHGQHVSAHPCASGLHLRHASQPLIGPPGMAILPAFVHQQIMYPADIYGTRHDLRAQQEVARAAIGISDPFGYTAIPPNAVSPSSFRQPLDPRLPHSSEGGKSESKSSAEIPNHIRDGRSRTPDDKVHHSSKSSRIKKEEKELKAAHGDDHEPARPASAHEKHLSVNSASAQSVALRQQHAYYPSTVRQLSPLLTVSPHERITDSPVVANVHAGAQGRMPPMPVADQIEEKSDGAVSIHQAHHNKGESTKRENKPPAAHQAHLSTIPYHSLDATVHPSARQQLLGVPQVGSPVPGYVDGRSPSQPAHSPNTLPYKKDAHHLQNIPTADKRTPGLDGSQKIHGRPLGHQTASPSPSLVSAHSPLPCSPVIQSHNAHHTMIPPGEQFPHRSQHIPQIKSEIPVHAPPPAHAMSQPSSIPRTLPQTSPQTSQVPARRESLITTERYPIVWQGMLELKNDHAVVQMHFVAGNPNIARASLPPLGEGKTASVRISQRMRLEENQLNGVSTKIQAVKEHCILMAIPCGKDLEDLELQTKRLNGFISYLLQKQAAGIVNAALPGSSQPAYVIHIFPYCEFSENILKTVAPDWADIISVTTHLTIVIATV